MSDFGYSSNSGLEQKRPKWNLTESSVRDSTKHFQNKNFVESLFIQFGTSIKLFPS